jgi:hypothetical protein
MNWHDLALDFEWTLNVKLIFSESFTAALKVRSNIAVLNVGKLQKMKKV